MKMDIGRSFITPGGKEILSQVYARLNTDASFRDIMMEVVIPNLKQRLVKRLPVKVAGTSMPITQQGIQDLDNGQKKPGLRLLA